MRFYVVYLASFCIIIIIILPISLIYILIVQNKLK